MTLAQYNSEQVLEEINHAYQQIDFTLAEQRIEAALDNYERFSKAQLTEIHKTLGLIKYSQNNFEAAKSQFEAALLLTPELALDPLEASPKLIAFFSEVAQSVETGKGDTNALEPIRYVYVNDPRPAAAWRSALLPGLGQRYKGQKRKGLLLTGMWTATITGSLVSHIERSRTQQAYLAVDPTNPSLIEKRYRVYDSWHQARNNLVLASAAIWLYAYLDALITHPPEKRIQLSHVGVSPAMNAHRSMQLDLVIRF